MVEKVVGIVPKIVINLMITLTKYLVKRKVTRRERNRCPLIKISLVGQNLYKNVCAMEKW
tara:strand:- start:616 stop:795 length:180 start_codon:yes stop_codon:yes gene_type:complete